MPCPRQREPLWNFGERRFDGCEPLPRNVRDRPRVPTEKAAGILALRLTGFENGLWMKAYPAPVSKAKPTLRSR